MEDESEVHGLSGRRCTVALNPVAQRALGGLLYFIKEPTFTAKILELDQRGLWIDYQNPADKALGRKSGRKIFIPLNALAAVVVD